MKKLLLPRIAFLILAVGACGTLVAQASGLALTLVNYTIQNDSGKVNLGYTITINAQITNDDTTQFVGQLDFGLRNNSQILTQNGNIFNKPPYSSQTITLNPGETVPAIFSVDIETPYFMPGPDVVVVWPISSKPVTDSVLIELNVQQPNALKNEEEALFNYIVLPDKILLQNIAYEKQVKQVRIYNVFGQLMAGYETGVTTEVPTGNLPQGIYLCEVYLNDRTRKVIKFLH
jgi:hypothetical protein